ncbi:MAG: iron-only hydrogenase system regulator [Clostridiales bacterium]|jgi:putative iron-only hydrogenase system regulator|nr:iron-only hydrogenase system regulator [Clostridiales bacterium]MDR2749402.1 iron-only hydrogenase system regulator [Clostridiales bacterium]
MEERVAVLAIIVDDMDSTDKLNSILHGARDHIVGRMGIPYRQKGMHVITIVIDAPLDLINTITGQLGRLPGVTAKAVYSTPKA